MEKGNSGSNERRVWGFLKYFSVRILSQQLLPLLQGMGIKFLINLGGGL